VLDSVLRACEFRADFAFESQCASATTQKPQPSTTTQIMADLLKSEDIKDWMKKLPEWDLEKKHIERTFEFDDFAQAIEFVNGVAEIAEEDEHHPEIDIRYSKVRLRLSTHSEGGLTDLDFELAEKIDTLVDE
jgi:4a-hydroxytetrahydrobiopterin dehydratase